MMTPPLNVRMPGRAYVSVTCVFNWLLLARDRFVRTGSTHWGVQRRTEGALEHCDPGFLMEGAKFIGKYGGQDDGGKDSFCEK